jgi:hypothetical protein
VAITDIAQRAAPFVESVLEDSDFRERVQAAGQAGRSAIVNARKGKPKRTVVQRAGVAVREAGSALVAISRVSQREQRKAKRRSAAGLLPVALAGSAAAGAAIALRSRSSQSSQPTQSSQPPQPSQPTQPAPPPPHA